MFVPHTQNSLTLAKFVEGYDRFVQDLDSASVLESFLNVPTEVAKALQYGVNYGLRRPGDEDIHAAIENTRVVAAGACYEA